MNSNIQEILKKGENFTVEFKTSFNKEVIETIVAFSNTKGGKIYLGINDKKEIVGIQLAGESIQNWINEIKQSTQHAVFQDFNVIETENKTIIEIVVDEFPLKPISYKNRYFSRKQNSNHLLSIDEIAEIGTHYTGIHIGRFKARDVIIDDMVIRSPLVLAVEEAMNFIKRNIRLGYEFTGEIQRKEIWQFPLPALRELLLNAVVHKDYSNPTDVIIKIFDENIEISNPGRLLNELTIEDLKTDHYQAKHRNKLLTEMFYLMGDIEKYGTGYARLRNWLKEYPNIQYTLVDLIDFFRIEFVEKIDRAQETHQETHQENIDKVLELVKLMENKKYSSKELMDLLKLSDIVNFRVLYRTPAQKAGYITMLYPDNPKHRNQQYFLTEKGMQTKTAIRK